MGQAFPQGSGGVPTTTLSSPWAVRSSREGRAGGGSPGTGCSPWAHSAWSAVLTAWLWTHVISSQSCGDPAATETDTETKECEAKNEATAGKSVKEAMFLFGAYNASPAGLHTCLLPPPCSSASQVLHKLSINPPERARCAKGFGWESGPWGPGWIHQWWAVGT